MKSDSYVQFEHDEKVPLVGLGTPISDAMPPTPIKSRWTARRMAVVGGLTVASILAIASTVCLALQMFDSPSFCHDLECPEFTVLEQLPIKDVELRAYPATTWVSTTVSGISYDEAVGTGFMRLFKYISGENMKEEKIAMTAPVVVDVNPGPGPTCGTEFTISFFSPVADPPEPSSKLVFVQPAEAANYYVMSYGGWATEKEVLKRAKELADVLTSLGRKFDDSTFVTAGYDSPFRLLRRHNEIAFAAV